jgi:lipoyl(octanoyl) transferase
VGERKIGAVGVRISQGIASHGLALNISPPLEAFDLIAPCGQPAQSVTSLWHELGGARPAPALGQAAEALVQALAQALGHRRIERLPEVAELVAANLTGGAESE